MDTTSRITAIAAQKRGRRVNLYVDDAFWLAVDREVLLEVPVRRGDAVTPALHEQLEQADERRRAYEAALNLLSYRPRAEAELRQRLQRKGLSAAACDWALERLRRAGLVNDEAFARAWLESRGGGAAAKGGRLLRSELRARGVAAAVIEAAEEATGTTDDEAAAMAAASARAARLRGVEYDEFRRRLGGFLQRRGFGYDVVSRVVRELWRAQGEERADEADD
jgi:regulatory protein